MSGETMTFEEKYKVLEAACLRIENTCPGTDKHILPGDTPRRALYYVGQIAKTALLAVGVDIEAEYRG